jgi:hypothetical protein
MSSLSWAGVVAMIAVALIGGRFALAGQRQQARTQEKVARVQTRSEESRMALDLAIETRDRLDILEDWEDSVREWWNTEHRPRDEIRDRALLAASPDALKEIPPLTDMPRPKRRKSET